MDNQKIEVGDVVQLKSGGVAMTVDSIVDNHVYCVWQINGEHFTQGYSIKSLKKYVKPKVTAGIIRR